MEGNSLKDLRPGQKACVTELSGEDHIKRRLQDMGLVRGTFVECVGKSPMGDPKAYLVRGTVIGLRDEDAQHIWTDETNNKPKEKRVIALAGNPNVGKSTVFNQLTGMRQHTGNWPGKTVANARGFCTYDSQEYEIVDIPGCYSLMAHSAEEEIARDFICFGDLDAVVVVCDATCLERNLNLVLQILEVTEQVVVCVNLMDEAEKKNIQIDLKQLEEQLKVPVIGTTARSKKGLDQIFDGVDTVLNRKKQERKDPAVLYPDYIEEAVRTLYPLVEDYCQKKGLAVNRRWLSLRLLDKSGGICDAMENCLTCNICTEDSIQERIRDIYAKWDSQGITEQKFQEDLSAAGVKRAEVLCKRAVVFQKKSYARKDRKLDWLFTSKLTGFPIMFLMLLGIFWITINGANYPSVLLNQALTKAEGYLVQGCVVIGIPGFLYEPLIFGVYRVLAWVVSVMLPPMAIFFPLFTLLEDFGYLPRVAFNLDKCFHKCHACGKQALTMCMGFGCNAVGVTGCRIIDSPRERLIAMLTNNFVPCNGRFPTLIAIITMFFVGTTGGLGSSFLSSFLLAGAILTGIGMTFLVSRILSGTILKGVPSSFTLELPPYRRPQIGKVIVRSVFDRTLFVLGRAALVAAPAGLLIWIMANIQVGGMTLLAHCIGFLDPFARLLGLDGVILMAFILGFPANEIVIPIMIMAYMANGSLVELSDLNLLRELLVANGWTYTTAVCTMLFSIMHWPCSTTCMTLKKETQSKKWTVAAFAIPTLTGMFVCFLAATIMRIIA